MAKAPAPRVQLFGLAKSKATRKAQRFFSERRIDVHLVDVARKPPSPGELRRFVQRFGAEALLDPSSRSYREQGLQYVCASDDTWIERMAADPSILALPLGRAGDRLSVGDDPSAWQALADAARG
jgi:arsenate reductase-like glutaredoxin family protein